eukprot:Em0014g597a
MSLPYSVEVACDLEQLSLAARRRARQLPSNHMSQQPKIPIWHKNLGWPGAPFILPQTTSYLHLSTNTSLSAGFKKGPGDLTTGLNKMGTYYHQTCRYLATILRLFGVQLCRGGGITDSQEAARVLLSEQEQEKIVDVDGSYTHRKYECLKEAGEQVLMPSNPPPPLTGWKQVTDANFKYIARSIPQVTSAALSSTSFQLQPNLPSTSSTETEATETEPTPVTSLPCQWKAPKAKKDSILQIASTSFEQHEYRKPVMRKIKLLEDFDPRPPQFRAKSTISDIH